MTRSNRQAKKRQPAKQPVAIPPKQQEQIAQIAIQAVTESFSGPLPHPAMLSQYEQISPGAAERIITMAESQSQHRQEMEKTVIQSDTKNSRLGLHYGLAIGLTAIICGSTCILQGHHFSGSFIGGGGIIGLVGVFVYGSRQRRKEREVRFKQETKPSK